MSRQLAVVGFVALAFGLGSYYATGELRAFNVLNGVVGAGALLLAAGLGLRGARGAGAPAFRGLLTRRLGMVLATALVFIALERLADHSGLSADWSFEQRFALSEATLDALDALGSELRATLYYDDFDPRIRRTRLLLETLARHGELEVDERRLEDFPGDVDRFAIGSSNTVVLQARDRTETVERPTEGALYEALYRLRSLDSGLLYVSHGAGEGDLQRTDEAGFSGLAQALVTEGYRLRQFVTASVDTIPDDADAVLLLAPRRPLRPEALAALDAYLRRGGRMVAFLEPGVGSGLEDLLAAWGMASPDARVVDPASGPVEGEPPGLNPIAFSYGSHPVGHGLDASRMTFFRGTRGFVLRKPEPDDELRGVVYASGRAWLAPEPVQLRGREPLEQPPEARPDYQPLVVAGRFERGGEEARIVAFGDVDLASNRHLRTLYNLDLVLNGVHWAVEREPRITLRPKASVTGRDQFPVPIQDTLQMLYGVGLALPELLLIGGALVWLRQRGA